MWQMPPIVEYSILLDNLEEEAFTVKYILVLYKESISFKWSRFLFSMLIRTTKACALLNIHLYSLVSERIFSILLNGAIGHRNNLNIIWPFDMGLSFLFEKVLSKRKTKGKGKMLWVVMICIVHMHQGQSLVTVWGMFSFWSGDCACKLYDGAYPTGYPAMQPSQSGPLSDILWGKPSGNRHIKEAEAENPELIRKGHCTQLRYQSRILLRENVWRNSQLVFHSDWKSTSDEKGYLCATCRGIKACKATCNFSSCHL